MTPLAAAVVADVRGQVADFLDALLGVYVVLIFLYIISSWFFAFGGRMPYNRSLNALLQFLRQVCEPFLAIFRRVIPPIGGLDLSPILAILTLTILGRIVTGLVRG
ncbi:MAG: YggT family protein [Solirubrobacteraceae bacterium]|nr:YggT family protein [Solirubrobacteraceae bacterium]